jgi:hypothetical protein
MNDLEAVPPHELDAHDWLVPLPAKSQSLSATKITLPLSPLMVEERFLSRFLGQILERAGLSIGAAARLLQVNPESLRQYVNGRRKDPGLVWFTKIVTLCGGRVLIELPEKGKR